MTDIEQKALALMNEVAVECGYNIGTPTDRRTNYLLEALCRAIEQHEAFRQVVSDAVLSFWPTKPPPEQFSRFIIAKPDPLVEAMHDCGVDRFESWADQLRAAIEKRGGKIVWGEG